VAAQAQVVEIERPPATTPQAAPAGSSAPAGGWRRAIGDCALVGSTTIVCQAIAACTSLLLRMFLSPAEMGIWQAARLWLGYANYANFGISKGAVREYNVALGRENLSDARRGLNIAFTVNTFSSILCAAALAATGLWFLADATTTRHAAWATALLAAAGMAVVSRYNTYHITILRARQRFAVCSQIALLEATLTLAICVTATWWFGLPGLCGGTLLVLLLVAQVIGRRRAENLRLQWHAGEACRLAAIGAPILVAGTLSTLLRSLDKLVILTCLPNSVHQLGCYSLALLVTGQLYGLGNMVSIAMNPRYAHQFGRCADPGHVARLAARATELHAAAVGLAGSLALVLAPPLLGRLMPDYREGLPPLLWLVPGVIALVLALPASQFLVAVGRQNRAALSLFLAVIMALGGNLLAVHAGWGLEGIAAATAAAYIAYWITLLAVSIWRYLSAGQRLRYATAVALTCVVPLAVAMAGKPWNPAADAKAHVLLLKAATLVPCWTAVVLLGWFLGWKQRGGHRHADNVPTRSTVR